jgi:hypothetical protein
MLVSDSTSFGNDAESTIRLMGRKGTMINYGTEGTPRWKWVEDPSHVTNWLDAAAQETPAVGARAAGFAHSVACIMAARACREKRCVYWDRASETIVDHPLATG